MDPSIDDEDQRRATCNPKQWIDDGTDVMEMLLYGINNHVMYLFNKRMGECIGLNEPEPENIIRQLSTFSRKTVGWLRGMLGEHEVQAAVQYGNESDMYLDDEELLDAMLAETRHPDIPVFPFIHQTSDKAPLEPGFVDHVARVLEICRRGGTRNITVHLPVTKHDPTAELVELLTGERFLDLLGSYKVSVDLENNWHDSWLGYHENIVEFYDTLSDRLQEIGRKSLDKYFGMTFDSGHLFAQYRIARRDVEEGIQGFIDDLGDRIRTLHLHGNDGSGDQHLCFREPPPGNDPGQGGAKGDPFLENQYALLSRLADLDLRRKATGGPWDVVIISEISSPFTWESYLAHSWLIFSSI